MNRNEKLRWYKKEFEDISNILKQKEDLSSYDFLRIRNFKLQNSTTENEVNIKKITGEAFKLANQDKIQEAINVLLKLNGVAIPIASTILAMKYPNKFAIIDKRVIKILNKKEWLKDYLKNTQTYEDYLLLLRKLSKEKQISLRDLERSLFEKDFILSLNKRKDVEEDA
jgi:thermostable 8-oxoguanine DNA glycosylase